MTAYRGDTLTGRIEVDGNQYDRCIFTKASLVYAGGEIPVFSGCTLKGAELLFEGPAWSTLAYLARIHDVGFEALVDGVLRQVKRPQGPPPEPPK